MLLKISTFETLVPIVLLLYKHNRLRIELEVFNVILEYTLETHPKQQGQYHTIPSTKTT